MNKFAAPENVPEPDGAESSAGDDDSDDIPQTGSKTQPQTGSKTQPSTGSKTSG